MPHAGGEHGFDKPESEVQQHLAAYFASALASNESLQSLDMVGNNASSDADLDAFRRGLAMNTTLRTLRIHVASTLEPLP